MADHRLGLLPSSQQGIPTAIAWFWMGVRPFSCRGPIFGPGLRAQSLLLHPPGRDQSGGGGWGGGGRTGAPDARQKLLGTLGLMDRNGLD